LDAATAAAKRPGRRGASNIADFFAAQLERADRGIAASPTDIEARVTLMLPSRLRGAGRPTSDGRDDSWYITSCPGGAAWERIKTFDADFFDFARWDAVSTSE
jgi:hypothetical protein